MVEMIEGRFYRNRRGEKVGPLKPWTSERYYPGLAYRWSGEVTGKKIDYLFTDSGAADLDGEEHSADIVSEWFIRLYVPYLHDEGHGYAILDWSKRPYTSEDINEIREKIAEAAGNIQGKVVPLGFQVLE